MNSKQIITTYEEILTITNKMLIAAQNHEWENLVALEQTCRKLTEQLDKQNPKPILSDDLQQRKIKIIHRVLADDAQIRMITEPWMMKLQNILGSTKRERNLQRAYQSNQHE
tara:strand:+ start:712 stop:1047 length:336 start_codon:yes stop_codon:yes gene_type:complete